MKFRNELLFERFEDSNPHQMVLTMCLEQTMEPLDAKKTVFDHHLRPYLTVEYHWLYALKPDWIVSFYYVCVIVVRDYHSNPM